MSWPIFINQIGKTEFGPIIEKINSELYGNEKSKYSSAIDGFFEEIHQFLVSLDSSIESVPKESPKPPKEIEKQELNPPASQLFSINNIEMGDNKQKVEASAGVEKRASYNEYGLNWYTYHENYQNFFMAAYDQNNKVVGLYTNQDLISSVKGISRGSLKSFVRQQLGEPLTKIEKETVYIQLKKDQDYDVYLMGGSYITIFYDKHQNNTVTAMQIINKTLENIKQDFYVEPSPPLIEGFEYQLFDLTNATRVNHGLSILTWNDHVRGTARKHSADMAENNYFDHTNLDGESPFDRMQEDRVVFTYAGENLAYGQFSSIFAHEGLMNSLGHRENILKSEFEFLGVGVAFNAKSQPYYTENFYAD